MKELIGDISPKALSEEAAIVSTSTEVSSSNAASTSAISSNATSSRVGSSVPSSESTTGIAASSWNHAGTWEERDISGAAIARLKELCLQATSEINGLDQTTAQDSNALLEAMESMKSALSSDGTNGLLQQQSTGTGSNNALEKLSASMSTYRGSIVNVNKCEGEAQIVIARGKKRCVYDFNMTLDFEVVVDNSWQHSAAGGAAGAASDTSSSSSSKPKKFKGSISVPDLSPTMPVELQVTFKKSIPNGAMENKVRAAVDKLKESVTQKIKEFEGEYSNI